MVIENLEQKYAGGKLSKGEGSFVKKVIYVSTFSLGTFSLVRRKKIMMHKGNAKRIILLKNRSELNFFPVDKLT